MINKKRQIAGFVSCFFLLMAMFVSSCNKEMKKYTVIDTSGQKHFIQYSACWIEDDGYGFTNETYYNVSCGDSMLDPEYKIKAIGFHDGWE